MRSLIWKEWHEQAWKLGFGCLVLAAMAGIGLRARFFPDEVMVMCACFVGFLLLPVLSATGLIPAERAENTFETLFALPVPPRRILIAKTAIGLLLCAGPMLIAAGVSVAVAGNREMSDWDMLALYGRSTMVGISLFIWILALTARLPSETRAGLVAIGVLVFWLVADIALVYPPVPAMVFAVSPFAYVYRVSYPPGNAPPLLADVGVQLAIGCILWAWTIRQLNCDAEGK